MPEQIKYSSLLALYFISTNLKLDISYVLSKTIIVWFNFAMTTSFSSLKARNYEINAIIKLYNEVIITGQNIKR